MCSGHKIAYKNKIIHLIPRITIFCSLVMRFAYDFHLIRHSWKLLANHLTCDPKIIIHDNSCIVLNLYYSIDFKVLIVWMFAYPCNWFLQKDKHRRNASQDSSRLSANNAISPVLPCRVRRKAIPEKPNYSLNLWSIMKNCIGKELTKIPMPVSGGYKGLMLKHLQCSF